MVEIDAKWDDGGGLCGGVGCAVVWRGVRWVGGETGNKKGWRCWEMRGMGEGGEKNKVGGEGS